jgi:hypothetical protein
LAFSAQPHNDEQIAAALPSLLELATAPKAQVRAAALESLARLARTSREVESAVGRGLQDASPLVRTRAARAAFALGPEAAGRMVPVLVRLLQDPDPMVREQTWNALLYSNARAPGLAPVVAKLLDDPTADVRKRSAKVLARLGADAKVVRPDLWKALGDRDADVRSEAARALVAIGSAASELDPATLTLLQDQMVKDFVNARLAKIISMTRPQLRRGTLAYGSGPHHFRADVLKDRGRQPAAPAAAAAPRAFGTAEAGSTLAMGTGGPTVAYAPASLPLATPSPLPPLALPAMQVPLKAFPWPAPPRYTHIGVSGRDFPRAWMAGDDATLKAVYDRLYQALLAVDDRFESSVFAVPDGFAMLAKMERTEEDGTPLREPYRFMQGPIPPLSLSEYIRRLFVEKPGHFRVIAFVVTSVAPSGAGSAPLPAIAEGGLQLTPDLAKLSFRGRDCYTLIYTFHKRPGGLIKFEDSGGLNVRTHLVKSGLWAVLSRPPL